MIFLLKNKKYKYFPEPIWTQNKDDFAISLTIEPWENFIANFITSLVSHSHSHPFGKIKRIKLYDFNTAILYRVCSIL